LPNPDGSDAKLQGWLALVAEAHRTGADARSVDGAVARRAFGGVNNALYRVHACGQSYAVKLCAPDDRRRAAHEYAALRLIQRAGLDIAPEPVLLDESCAVVPFPAVMYRWLDGKPLTGKFTAIHLAALGETFRAMHSLRPSDFPGLHVPDAWSHWFDFAPYLSSLRTFMDDYGPWLADALPGGADLRDRLARLTDDCVEALSAARVEVSRERVPLRLCRVDPNPGNAIWCDDGKLRWIDWEYGGWGDPALDLADLRWHAAIERLGEARHAWLRMNYGRPVDDPTFDERLALWDRLMVTRWPFLTLRWLWSQHNGPDRLRLSPVDADPEELRRSFVRLIERAERFGSRTE
jgi:aminoglycoside phosphotransferase (APT) family kinase protein